MAIGQFDLVKILTTKRVTWMSSDQQKPNPHGTWTVVAVVHNEAVISRDDTVVRIPTADLRLVAAYDMQTIINSFTRVTKNAPDQSITPSPSVPPEKAR